MNDSTNSQAPTSNLDSSALVPATRLRGMRLAGTVFFNGDNVVALGEGHSWSDPKYVDVGAVINVAHEGETEKIEVAEQMADLAPLFPHLVRVPSIRGFKPGPDIYLDSRHIVSLTRRGHYDSPGDVSGGVRVRVDTGGVLTTYELALDAEALSALAGISFVPLEQYHPGWATVQKPIPGSRDDHSVWINPAYVSSIEGDDHAYVRLSVADSEYGTSYGRMFPTTSISHTSADVQVVQAAQTVAALVNDSLASPRKKLAPQKVSVPAPGVTPPAADAPTRSGATYNMRPNTHEPGGWLL